MVPSIPERDRGFIPILWIVSCIIDIDRWFLPVQGWFPGFLRETDGSYMYKDCPLEVLRETDGSYLYKECPPEFLRETDGFYLYKDGSQHS